MSYFWTNTIWYILLGVTTSFQLFFVITKSQNRQQTFAFYLTILGIVLSFESVILIFLKAYTYYPKIIPNPPLPFDDVLAGNLFSQFSVAATALLAIVFNLNYYWFFLFGGMYGIIEESFLALGIYSHNWYRTWMTVTIFPLFCWLAKIMYAKITRGTNPLLYYGFIFLGLFSLNIITLTWGFMLLRLQDFSRTVLSDPVSSRHFLVIVHFLLLSISMMFIYFSRLKWRWKALVILVNYIIYYSGYVLNLVWIKKGWFLPVSTITIFWMYLSILILDRLYGGNRKSLRDSKYTGGK